MIAFCARFYGGLPSQWLEEPHENLISAFMLIPRVRDNELLHERAYMNADKKELAKMRRSMEVDIEKQITMDDIRAKMTPEERKAHDGFIARHRRTAKAKKKG